VASADNDLSMQIDSGQVPNQSEELGERSPFDGKLSSLLEKFLATPLA